MMGECFPLGMSTLKSLVSACEALKTLIKNQLSGDIGALEDSYVGFLEGANLVQMRNYKDLEEAWDVEG